MRALYGLRTNGSAWRYRFANSLRYIELIYSYADPDVWTKIEILKDGRKLYTYIIVYVDGFLVIAKDPKFYMDAIASQFRLK